MSVSFTVLGLQVRRISGDLGKVKAAAKNYSYYRAKSILGRWINDVCHAVVSLIASSDVAQPECDYMTGSIYPNEVSNRALQANGQTKKADTQIGLSVPHLNNTRRVAQRVIKVLKATSISY